MVRRYRSPKIVADPICGIIDITKVLPIVETKEFQALSDKRQLGMISLIFRSATHSRFVHCLGAYYATCVLTDRWFLEGIITQEERDALCVYALIHDVGHPAFSHTTEDFCGLDNDAMTVEMLTGELGGVIASLGVNTELVIRFAKKEHPLYRAVHDKNLGTEKLDYLVRDGFYTILSRPVGVEYLRKYIYYVNEQVVIDEKVVENMLDTLTFYMKMYKEVYLRKASVIAQRMFQKMLYHLIAAGELAPAQLPYMTDSELIGALHQSREETVCLLYRRIFKERNLFREGVVIRPERFASETRIANKHISVVGISQQEMSRVVDAPAFQRQNHAQLEEVECAIANAVGIPAGEVLLVPVFNPERFEAQDVLIYGSDGALHSLRERREAHFRSMEEVAQAFTALRVCTTQEHRGVLSAPSATAAIKDLVLSQIRS